jgi:hypothetical protein
MAATERPVGAIIDLVIAPAVVGAIIDCMRDVEAAMIAKSPREVAQGLPFWIDERAMDRRIGRFGGTAP